MTQPFVLTCSSDLVSLDFMGGTRPTTYSFRLDDNGFEISLPRVKRELIQDKPGFYIPVVRQREYREAEIRFTIFGASRGQILSAIAEINKVGMQLEQRGRLGAGYKAELAYAWDGATSVTYFDVFSVEFLPPGDILSLETIHAMTSNGIYMLPGCKLKLYLSADGYGVSLRNYTYPYGATSLYIASATTARTQSGAIVFNPYDGAKNWVKVLSADIASDSPMISIIELTPQDAEGMKWHTMYIGHKQGTDNSHHTNLTDAYTETGVPGSDQTDAYGNFLRIAPAAPPVIYDPAWTKQFTKVGTYLAFLAGHAALPATMQFANVVDDTGAKSSTPSGVYYTGKYVTSVSGLELTLPLGMISLPMSQDLVFTPAGFVTGEEYGGQYVGFSIMASASTNIDLEYLYWMPIDNGLRVWRNRLTDAEAPAYTNMKFVDDIWRGAQYLRNTSTDTIIPSIYGLLNPIKLLPGVDNYVYFTSIGAQTIDKEENRDFSVKIYGIPTYATLAL